MLSNTSAQMSQTAPPIDPSDWSVTMLARQGKPPLRFKGRRLTQHCAALSSELVITIELWQQAKGGLVVSYSYFDGRSLERKAIQVSNLAEATDCLENVCANLEKGAIEVPVSDMDCRDLHILLCFQQRFRLVSADVLADWHIHPQLQEFA